MASGLKRFVLSPLFLATGSVIVVLVLLVGRADMALFGSAPGLWASVNYLPLPSRGGGAPILPHATEYPGVYVIRVRNAGTVAAPDVRLTAPDGEFALRETSGVLDSLPGTNGRFRVGAVVPGADVVLWVLARATSAQDRRSAVRVDAGSAPVPMTVYAPFRSATLFVILHLSQMVIGLIVVEGLVIAGVLQMLRRLRGEARAG